MVSGRFFVSRATVFAAVGSILLSVLLAVSTEAAPIPGKIAFVGLDHQIYVVDPNGGEPVPLTHGETGRMTEAPRPIRPVSSVQGERRSVEQRFSWPTWSPDGRTILAQGITVAGGSIPQQAGIYRLDVSHPGTVAPLYENREHGPIYLYYSPTGEEVAALLNEPGAVGLALFQADDGVMHPLGLGFPYYFSWRNDGKAIVTHTGGAPAQDHTAEVTLMDVRGVQQGGKPEATELTDAPVLFRAPAWSPDGTEVAYAVRREAGRGAALVVRSNEGRERELAPVSSRVVFSWSPDGKTLAVAEAATPDNLLFGGINLVHLSDGHRETLYAGPVGAFFWSPDGRRLLVAAPEFDSAEWRWEVVERASRRVRQIGRFFPTPEFQFMAPHFDQFAQSHHLWAPDSRHFVYFGYPTQARDSSQFVPATVWVADTRTAKVHRVADGRLAFWSPR